MGREMKKYIVGPMPPQAFLDKFFPASELSDLDTIPEFEVKCYDQTIAAFKESSTYKPFVSPFGRPLYPPSAVHIPCFKIEATEKFAPHLKLVDSSNSVDSNTFSDFPFKIKPDISVYRGSDPRTTSPGFTDSATAEIFIEFKWSRGDDPFDDVHDVIQDGKTVRCFFRETKAGDDTLGQITSYAAVQLGAQFRTHVYSVLIVKETARILRWDRTGTIVTEPIKYNASSLLADFFRRYSCAPPNMRGVDQSVSDPTPAEVAAARKSLVHDDTIPLVKLEIPVTADRTSYFIVPAPRATPYTPPGRATRVFTAYDIMRKKNVILKDSWRVNLEDIKPEGVTYDVLMKANVRHIPRCLDSGDITAGGYQATITMDYTTAPWACFSGAHFVPHQHYRLALDIIGRPVYEFKSSREMVAAMRDALTGESQFRCKEMTLIDP
jgi:hypothetical protein